MLYLCVKSKGTTQVIWAVPILHWSTRPLQSIYISKHVSSILSSSNIVCT